MKQNIIQLFDDETGAALIDSQGRPRFYIPLEERVPLFLAEYPHKQGYRVATEMYDLLSVRKGLLSVLKEAIAAGRKISELGLMGLEETMTTLVCTARLFDPNDRELRTASANACLLEKKDLEKLESAAFNRLISALGFDGNITFEEVEARRKAEALMPSQAPIPAPSSPSNREESPSERRDRTPLVALPEDDAALQAQSPEGSAEGVTKAQRAQVAGLAKRLGVPGMELKTAEDFQRELKRLGDLSASQSKARRPGVTPGNAAGRQNAQPSATAAA
jgi:hypothetical protein